MREDGYNQNDKIMSLQIELDRDKLYEDLAFITATMVEEQRLNEQEIDLANRKIELREAKKKLKSFIKTKSV